MAISSSRRLFSGRLAGEQMPGDRSSAVPVIYPSERIRMMQEVKSKLDELKQSGISAFVGQFDQNMVVSSQPDKPFKWTIAVIRLLPVGAKQILNAPDGSMFSVAMIPKRNLRMS